MLQQAAVGPRHRQVTKKSAIGCPRTSSADKHLSENDDTAELWLKNLERQRARCAYQGDRP
ncbi:hypothetical protein DB771_21350 [Burkholderia sp. AU29985]|nr:hypothetical protein EGY28_07685 [Burkholderia dolosa]PRE49952.1 hypothetical protein C6P87_13415 [Burkholderia sp. AU12872]PUA74847.1 hypothetical protein DB771_21350 [Burkholderia sp. AU29985]